MIEPLIRELEHYPNAEHKSYLLEAAEEVSDPRLLPILLEVKRATGQDDRLMRPSPAVRVAISIEGCVRRLWSASL